MAKGNRKGSKTKAGSTKKRQRDVDSEQGSDPDVDSDSYFQDDVDKFHSDRDQILLDSGAKLPSDAFSSGEDEVLAFDDDDEDDDEQYQEMKKRLHQIRSHGHHEAMASDLEEDEEKQKTQSGKSEKAWGASRSKFYGGHDSDLEDQSGSELEADALEEEEALAVQKRLLLAMDEDDVGLGMVKKSSQLEEKTTEKITQDLSKLSKREKLKLLKKQSPELLDLISDFKTRTEELQIRLLPVVNLIRNHKLPAESSGAHLVETKTALYLNYLVNVSFYLMLKAKQSSVENHPVIKRLVQYRKLIKQMDELEPRCQSKMDSILQRLAKGEEFPTIQDQELGSTTFKSVLLHKKKLKPANNRKASNMKRLSEVMDSSESDSEVKDGLDLDEGGRTWGRKKSKLEVADHLENGEEVEKEADEEAMEEEANDMERRGINYQIEKNKGLTTRKRKELRNPRVKHKLKYRKAKIRRKGQVREVRKEMDRYGGEISGIRAGIKRSVRLQ